MKNAENAKRETINCRYVWSDLNSDMCVCVCIFDLLTHEYFWNENSQPVSLQNWYVLLCFISSHIWFFPVAAHKRGHNLSNSFLCSLHFILSISWDSWFPFTKVSNRSERENNASMWSPFHDQRSFLVYIFVYVRIFIWQCFPIIYAFWLFLRLSFASSVMLMATTIDAHKNA